VTARSGRTWYELLDITWALLYQVTMCTREYQVMSGTGDHLIVMCLQPMWTLCTTPAKGMHSGHTVNIIHSFETHRCGQPIGM
jgi:hypothetical protein